MRFDDRLLTVLNQPAGDRYDLAVRWRQLVDLVARAGPNAASPNFARALESIRNDAPNVDVGLRAAAARAVAALPLPLALLEYFASESLEVSAPVLAGATLQPAQWQAMLDSADAETRRFIHTLHAEVREDRPALAEDTLDLTERLGQALESLSDDLTGRTLEEPVREEPPSLLGSPSAEEQDAADDLPAPASEPEEPSLPTIDTSEGDDRPFAEPETEPDEEGTAAGDDSSDSPVPSLKELIDRIERRRRALAALRDRPPVEAPAEELSQLFRWECGPGGDIAWVDGAPRGAVIGRSIARDQAGDRIGPDVARAFMLRAPFRDGMLSVSGDGAVSGEWKISGVPAFEPTDGRFAGYRGVALREQDNAPATHEPLGLFRSDPDSVRELVHEIKTPLNAIMGFAEIIEGQYLGPADERYRQRAQEIVRQAGLLLTAIDDLDFAAMVHSSSAAEQRRTNLGELVERMIPGLRELAHGRGLELDASRTMRDTSAATEPELADRLIFRMCSAVIDKAQPGEHLRLTVERAGERSRVSMTSPAALSDLPEEQLLGGETGLEQGFPLRLVRGLARLAGADLTARQGSISLLFPRL